MTDFHVETIRVGDVYKHPNADSLSITNVGAYPVIFRTGDYSPGDLAVYVPENSVVPLNDPRWSFLNGKDRIRAKKLRGMFSCGLLTPAEPGMVEGQDVAEQLRIVKYLTIEERKEFGSQAFQKGSGSRKSPTCPVYLPRYTDIENLRRHPNAFAPGQEIIVTEKIEGENAAFCYNPVTNWQKFKRWLGFKIPGPVLCRSRNQMKTEGKWFELIDKLDLVSRFEKLEDPDDYSIYGESYGYTKGFDYGTDRSGEFLVFDIWDRAGSRWLDLDEAYHVCEAMGLDMVDILYRGPFDMDIITNIANQKSVYGNHIKEGVIVRSTTEQTAHRLGRMIFKFKCDAYLLRND
jgi:RNA ligase (TIGR02306 family)